MKAVPKVVATLAFFAILLLFLSEYKFEIHSPENTVVDTGGEQQLLEVRIFQCDSLEKQKITLNYVENALMPALNRQGVSTVGSFLPIDEKDTSVVVFIPYTCVSQWIDQNDKLESDAAYQAAALPYFNLSLKDPAYKRIDSRVMRAFSGMPKLELPPSASADRILELRIYESHNESRARLKVEMFNQGEIDLMQEVGLAPVFFGETLAASDLPNLTYVLSSDAQGTHEEHWKAFLQNPEWKRMSRLPRYEGTVSKITSTMLFPTRASQI